MKPYRIFYGYFARYHINTPFIKIFRYAIIANCNNKINS